MYLPSAPPLCLPLTPICQCPGIHPPRLEVLGLVCTTVSTYCGSFFFNSVVSDLSKIGIAALVVLLNVSVVTYFVFNILVEVVRTTLDLEEIHRAEVLRLLESRVWPEVAYMPGRAGRVAKFLFVRLVLFMERRVSRRWRGGGLKRTRDRLDAKLQTVVRAANWRERLRRSTNVCSWVMQGLITTPEIAAEVARYEARARENAARREAAARVRDSGCSFNRTLQLAAEKRYATLRRKCRHVEPGCESDGCVEIAVPRPLPVPQQDRGRDGSEPVWQEILEESLQHAPLVADIVGKHEGQLCIGWNDASPLEEAESVMVTASTPKTPSQKVRPVPSCRRSISCSRHVLCLFCRPVACLIH